jgi:hypothetical protein
LLKYEKVLETKFLHFINLLPTLINSSNFISSK